MPKHRALKIAAGIVASFAAFVVTIILLSETGIVTFQMALLMLVALFGMYLGFGILIAVYRFISKLE